MNKALLIGTVLRPERKETANGFPFFKCVIVTRHEYPTKDGEVKVREEEHNIIAWGNQAKLRGGTPEGSLVSIDGRIQTRRYTDQQGNDLTTTEIVANDIQILRGVQDEAAGKPAVDEEAPAPPEDGLTDDDIPF